MNFSNFYWFQIFQTIAFRFIFAALTSILIDFIKIQFKILFLLLIQIIPLSQISESFQLKEQSLNF